MSTSKPVEQAVLVPDAIVNVLTKRAADFLETEVETYRYLGSTKVVLLYLK